MFGGGRRLRIAGRELDIGGNLAVITDHPYRAVDVDPGLRFNVDPVDGGGEIQRSIGIAARTGIRTDVKPPPANPRPEFLDLLQKADRLGEAYG